MSTMSRCAMDTRQHHRSTPTDLFASPIASDDRAPGPDIATWDASFASWIQSGAVEPFTVAGTAPGSTRLAYRLGGAAARDHAWVVCDGDAVGAARAAWSVVDALGGTRPSRFRQLLTGRARVSIVLPDPAAPALRGHPAILDAVPPATEAGILTAFEADPPTIVLHIQDVGGAARQRVPASGRMIESYTIGADLHRALGEGSLRRRTWYGRQTVVARTLADHPDARIGDLAAAACKRAGFSLRDAPTSPRRGESPGTIRLGPGRFLPTFTYRRLGASSLAEIALARFGAHGITVQVFDGTTNARIGTALSIAEGALLARLGLETS